MSYYNAGNAVKIQSFDVSSLYPKDGQFLKFINATKEWTPTTLTTNASSGLEISGLTLWENPVLCSRCT